MIGLRGQLKDRRVKFPTNCRYDRLLERARCDNHESRAQFLARVQRGAERPVICSGEEADPVAERDRQIKVRRVIGQISRELLPRGIAVRGAGNV